MKRILVGALALGLLFADSQGRAQDNQLTPYLLEKGSFFAWGCFELCDCLVVQTVLDGSFELRRLEPDPLFDHYEVRNVRWNASGSGGQTIPITGSGTYRVGGEFAVQHRMTLDLVVNGQPTQHFDSGLVLGGGEFPRISIDVRLHRPPACSDTVITVKASPPTLDVGQGGLISARVTPNPFRSRAKLDLVLRAAARVDVAIHEVSGRLVKRLATGAWMGAGPHSLEWDGRGSDGSESAAGLYFVRIRVLGSDELRTLVKLR